MLCVVHKQVTFGFTSPIAWDKAPNRYGQKTVAVDPSGATPQTDAEWKSSLASVGSHLIMLAVHQGIIDLEDLKSVALGEVFTISDLLRKRNKPDAEAVDDMCAAAKAVRCVWSLMACMCMPLVGVGVCTVSLRADAVAGSAACTDRMKSDPCMADGYAG